MLPVSQDSIFTKLRAVADRELTRQYPCWSIVRFIRADYDEERYIWELTYAVAFGHNTEAHIARIDVYETCFADGSPAFQVAGVL